MCEGVEGEEGWVGEMCERSRGDVECPDVAEEQGGQGAPGEVSTAFPPAVVRLVIDGLEGEKKKLKSFGERRVIPNCQVGELQKLTVHCPRCKVQKNETRCR